MSNPEDRANNPSRVVDFNTFKMTGKRVEAASPEMVKHEDEAMALGNSNKAPAAKHGPVRRGLVKVTKALGMEDPQ